MSDFGRFSENVQKIAREKPAAWEFLLTAALMKELFKEPLRRWRQLQSGVLTKPRQTIDDENVFPWLETKMQDVRDLARSFSLLYSVELQKSWGEPGVSGDPIEILAVIEGIQRVANQAVDWELDVKFTKVSALYDGLIDVLFGAIGVNLPKLMDAAELLDNGLKEWQKDQNKPLTINHTIEFNVPPNFNDQLDAELDLIVEQLGIDR